MINHLHGRLVIGIGWFGSRRAKEGHRRTNAREGVEGIDKFRHDAEYAPGILLHVDGLRIVHARKIGESPLDVE